MFFKENIKYKFLQFDLKKMNKELNKKLGNE